MRHPWRNVLSEDGESSVGKPRGVSGSQYVVSKTLDGANPTVQRIGICPDGDGFAGAEPRQADADPFQRIV